MASRSCRVCGAQLMRDVKNCPRCGTPVRNIARYVFVGALIGSVGLAAAFRSELNRRLRDVAGVNERDAKAAAEAAAIQPPSWVLFATQDPSGDGMIRTARVIEMVPPVPVVPGQPMPAPPDPESLSALEIRATGRDERHASLQLRQVAAEQCLQIATVSFRFDGSDPQTFPVIGSVNNGACVLEITGFKRFLEGVRYTTTTEVSVALPGGARRLSFHTANLTWGES